MSFVTRTGDRKSKTGVVQLKSIDGSEGVLTSKPKKYAELTFLAFSLLFGGVPCVLALLLALWSQREGRWHRGEALTHRCCRLLLKVDRQNLGIHSKDGKNLLQQFPVEMCSFKMSDDVSCSPLLWWCV